jgi:Flp pilus assembly protein TadB
MTVQVNRMRDGHSRVTHLMKAVDTEGDVILITLVIIFIFALVAILTGGQHLLPGVLIGAGLGNLILHCLIGRMGRKRVAAFIALFPQAIDLMVPGAALRPANQLVEHEVW